MAETAKRVKTLENTINKKIDSWNERSMFTISGVKNLSRSDLDTILLYTETISKEGCYTGYLRKPLGEVRSVLAANGLLEES
jgi:hypothetical protein